MITEIVIGRTYFHNVSGDKRRVLFFDDKYVFYILNEKIYNFTPSSTFIDTHSEIPEAPEEWFEVFYRLKNGKLHPTLASHLYRSKEDFLSCYKKEEESFDLIKLRKVDL